MREAAFNVIVVPVLFVGSLVPIGGWLIYLVVRDTIETFFPQLLTESQ